jgi:hypothetical protein
LLGLLFAHPAEPAAGQCLSSINPVGGSANLLVLDRDVFRAITYYRHASSNRYFDGYKKSEFSLVERAAYNFIGTTLAFGLLEKMTLEAELGYFLNKSFYFGPPLDSEQTGRGFYNVTVSGKFRLFTDYAKRFFVSGSAGMKFPLSLEPKKAGNITLPVELQPSTNAFGSVLQLHLVKEYSETGMRYFFIHRFEYNLPNRYGYKVGQAFITSAFVSKYLPDHWIKGDWTAILQLRNESRSRNIRDGEPESATGGTFFFLAPQVTWSIHKRWNLSLIADIPLFQYFNEIQLSYNYAITLNLSRDFTGI